MFSPRKKLFFCLLLIAFTPIFLAAGEHKTRNLVLVTTDGLRGREVFRGIDPELMHREDAGMKKAERLRESLWAETPEQRRRLLMPFLWDELALRGVIFGNRDRGSSATVRNRHRFSYPGYSEILTGRPQDDVIDSNDLRPNPSRTVLEILRDRWRLPKAKVALFGSWEVFRGIGARDPDAIVINAGDQEVSAEIAVSGRMRELSRLQFDLLTPWRGIRHDYITFEMALEYLKTVKPRVLFIAFAETDDWAHERNYDRTLETAKYFDACLKRLWEAIENDPEYRGRTTMLVTTDHGRGSTPENWHSHGADVEGAENIWIAAVGPDTTARGEAQNAPAVEQSDIAPTMLELAGVDYRQLTAVEGKPIAWVVGE